MLVDVVIVLLLVPRTFLEVKLSVLEERAVDLKLSTLAHCLVWAGIAEVHLFLLC